MTESQYEKFKNQVISIVSSLQGAQEYFVEFKISYGSYHHLFVFYRPEKNSKGLFVHKCKYGKNRINVWHNPDINEIFLVDVSKRNFPSSYTGSGIRQEREERFFQTNAG